MRPLMDYGYRDTVFFPEQPKILDIDNPFITTAYELNYHMEGDEFRKDVIGGSIFLNDAHTLSFVQNGPEGKRPYYVAEKLYVVGTPEYPLGLFIPFSSSPDAMRQAAFILESLADGDELSQGEKGEFFDYEDFK